MKYYLGCTQWQHDHWAGLLYSKSESKRALFHYGQSFATVEGNTTFYALPSQDRFKQWMEAVPDHFRFCFKLPKSISHDNPFEWNSDGDQFFNLLHRFPKLQGPIMIQVPPGIGCRQIDKLANLLERLPRTFAYAMEVRNMDFFDKGENEKSLNQLLSDYNVNRTIFDNRGLFNDKNTSAAIADAQSKKPRFPLHVLTTGEQPFIRFLGYSDMELNREYWQQWYGKIGQWIQSGKQPYFMMHTAGNGRAPKFASAFSDGLNRYLVENHIALDHELPSIELSQNTEQQGLF